MNPTEAEEHLRVIRSLMERATIYRAISAPTAFIGGLLSIAACALEFWFNSHWPNADSIIHFSHFLAIWLTVLLLTGIANTLFIWKCARKRGEPFFSAGMKMTALCWFPAFLCAFVFTLFFSIIFEMNSTLLETFLPPFWMLFYGLALLASSHFAPRSIIVLGWCFLIAGLLAFMAYLGLALYPGQARFLRFLYHGNFLMAATFGLFHLIYAACTWPRKASQLDSTTR